MNKLNRFYGKLFLQFIVNSDRLTDATIYLMCGLAPVSVVVVVVGICQSRATLYMYMPLPFCSKSKCSQSMSPVQGGVMARNFSLPSSTISRPVILQNGPRSMESRENSFLAQLSQQMTCSSVHSRGSTQREIENKM